MNIKFFRWLLPVLVLLLTGLHCSKQSEAVQTEKEIVVKTVPVTRKAIILPVHTSGKLVSKAEKKLSFKIGGIVKELVLTEGQIVRKGQQLAALDLAEINAQVNKAQSAFEKASRDFARAEKLFADSVVTLEQLQDAKTGFEIAQSNLMVAEFNKKHAVITAPEAGKILKRFIEKNEWVGPGVPVFLFGSTGMDWIVRVGVSDRAIIRLQIGDSARISFDVYPDVKFFGRVSEITQAADPRNGTYEVELTLTPGAYKLVSGFVAKVDIYPSRQQKFAFVPIEALIEMDQNQGYVFHYDSRTSTVEKMPVTIGHLAANEIGIASGLEGSEEVVTEGISYLKDGSRVTIRN